MPASGKLGRYRLISTIGVGGMGTVTLAEDTLLDRPVALKRMTAGADARALSRLRREALLGASVNHRNLVSIYDVVTSEEDSLVIVMEYVRGETLRDALTRQGRLGGSEALGILEGVAAGLDAIHKRGIVHRDVKPSNILLGADGTVKVADLGIASVPDRTRITTSGAVLGSLSYMSPEQLADARSTSAMDVYALAAVAFEVLSGRKARRAPNPVALARAISTQPPPDLREAWPAAPSAAAELLIRGMSLDPAARPHSAGELIRQLRAALEPEDTASITTPQTAECLPAPPPMTRQAKREHDPPLADDVVAPSPRAEQEDAYAGRSAPIAAGRPGLTVPPSAAPSEPSAVPRRIGPTRPARSAAGAPRPARLVAGALLALVAAAVALAVVLNTGGPQPQTLGSSQSTLRSQPAGAASAATPDSPRSAAASNGNAKTSAASPAATSPSAASPANGNPVSAVESFYALAASHRYADAWALADPTFQGQVRGYQSFQASQAGDRSITFNAADTVSRSSTGATVAVRTTSLRTDGTHHCAGTVDLHADGSSGPWLLHMIHINCT